jgi:hypothetical protein
VAPFHQIPVFEVNGVELCQTLAIMRYIAQKYGEFMFLFYSEITSNFDIFLLKATDECDDMTLDFWLWNQLI